MRIKELYEQLDDPAATYRSAPFWSWNGDLKPEELEEQINGFAEKGIGGFLMHAREGLETEYLSEDWMACIRACVKKG